MSNEPSLNEVLDHASRTVAAWPDWMRSAENQSVRKEVEPGRLTRKQLEFLRCLVKHKRHPGWMRLDVDVIKRAENGPRYLKEVIGELGRNGLCVIHTRGNRVGKQKVMITPLGRQRLQEEETRLYTLAKQMLVKGDRFQDKTTRRWNVITEVQDDGRYIHVVGLDEKRYRHTQVVLEY